MKTIPSREGLGKTLYGQYHCDRENGVLGDRRWRPDPDGSVCLLDYQTDESQAATLRAFGFVLLSNSPTPVTAAVPTMRLIVKAQGREYLNVPVPLLMLGARALDMAPHGLYGDMVDVLYGAWKPARSLLVPTRGDVQLRVWAPPQLSKALQRFEVDPPEGYLFDLTAYAEGLLTRTMP